MNDTKIFNWSKSPIVKTNFLIFKIWAPLFLLFLFTNHPEITPLSASIKLVVFFVTLIMTESILYFQPKLMEKKVQKLYFEIDNISLKKINDKVEAEINIEDIKRVEAHCNLKGTIRRIKIFGLKDNMSILSVERLEELYASLQQLVGNEKCFRRNKRGYIFENPIVMIIYMIIISYAMLWYQTSQINIKPYLDNIIPVVLGTFFIISKPISSLQTKKFEKFELILGIILVILGCLGILLEM